MVALFQEIFFVYFEKIHRIDRDITDSARQGIKFNHSRNVNIFFKMNLYFLIRLMCMSYLPPAFLQISTQFEYFFRISYFTRIYRDLNFFFVHYIFGTNFEFINKCCI